MIDRESRWAGRNEAKATVRNRVWERLVATGANIGPVSDCIPNFVGADAAAKRLSELDAWKRARVVKCNPDPPQIAVRLRALYEGKLLFAPVPYLNETFPYLRIDPEKLVVDCVDFETAATAQGFVAHGEHVRFQDMPKLDFCVVGCVAVTRSGGRSGKGAGFADLEQGIFREFGLVDDTTPIATTVHSSQVVDDAEVVMESHDSALTFIATELELIETRTPFRQPAGVAWDKVRPDQFVDIPFLDEVRAALEARETRDMIVDDPVAKAEVEAAFSAYERALVANDVAALDGFFITSAKAIRYGVAENLYGYEAIKAFRAARTPAGLARKLEKTQIVTYGLDLAVAATLFRRDSAPDKVGRQMQTWVRLPEGWRIVAAHVSVIDEPA